MSKRAGDLVLLDDLLDDIGVDAARWFLLQRSHDTTFSTSTSSWPGGNRRTTPSTTFSTPTRGSPASCERPVTSGCERRWRPT